MHLHVQCILMKKKNLNEWRHGDIPKEHLSFNVRVRGINDSQA